MVAASIEGGPNETNFRRGPGSYDRIVKGMELLRECGMLYGFSAVHTQLNHEVIANQAFFKDMLDRGCAYGWVFQYIPVGREPSFDLMPTAVQRYERMLAIEAFREHNPLLIFDFWNDGEMVDGCMAYGRKYMHMTSTGQIEPCVFVQYTRPEFNIRKTRLKDILLSEPLRAARKRAPFTGENIAPCSLIDNTDFLPEFVAKYGLVPTTAEGVGQIMTPRFREELARRSAAYRELMAAREAKDTRAAGASPR
jgi:MoaA/NifB/PqqE/SkfB family radical SAM enzyme